MIRGDFWGLLPGEHVLFTPGHALQSTLRQTYCHRIYDVCVILHGETSGAYYRGNMYCSPRDTRSRAHCDRLTVTEYTMCVSYCMGRLLGPITGGTCIVHPGTCAPEHTVTDLLSQNIRCVCVILHGQTSGAYYREHLRCLPRDAPLQRALRHACRQDTYCVLLTGYTVCY